MPMKLHSAARAMRFIPTRVGQICTPPVVLWITRPVHPHSCGADIVIVCLHFLQDSGSSPRVWGRFRAVDKKNCIIIGSSPRVWGRCQSAACVRVRTAVHPHACGADGPRIQRAGCQRPVHPHACGADELLQTDSGSIIPVHPHACGADTSQNAAMTGF